MLETWQWVEKFSDVNARLENGLKILSHHVQGTIWEIRRWRSPRIKLLTSLYILNNKINRLLQWFWYGFSDGQTRWKCANFQITTLFEVGVCQNRGKWVVYALSYKRGLSLRKGQSVNKIYSSVHWCVIAVRQCWVHRKCVSKLKKG